MDLFRRAGSFPSYLVGKLLIVTDIKPILPAIGCPGFQGVVQLFYERFREPFLSSLNDKIDAAEVVGCFYDIIDIHAYVRYADGVGFENIARLLVGKPAALDMVGIVSEVNLRFPVPFPWLTILDSGIFNSSENSSTIPAKMEAPVGVNSSISTSDR